MVSVELLSMYFGGVIVFLKDAKTDGIQFKKGQEVNIVPSIIHFVAHNKIPRNAYKLVLRRLDQLSDSELIELSKITVKPSNYAAYIRRVERGKVKGKNFNIMVHVSNGQSFVINQSFDMSLNETTPLSIGIKPMVTNYAVTNQTKATRWLLDRHVDILNLIPQGFAIDRKEWNDKNYIKPKGKNFNRRNNGK